MELLLDTANLEAIKKYNDYYEIVGVTTNPTILCKEKQPFFKMYEQILDIIGEEKQLHIQVTGQTCEEMMKEAETITSRFGKGIYVKVPVIEEGVKAMKLLHKDGYKLTATAVLTPQQAFLAGSVGADYVAPYVNRMANLNFDPYDTIERIRTVYELQDIDTKILGASFKNTQQIMKAYESGAHAVTIPAEFLTQMCTNGVVDGWVKGFDADWKGLYGNTRIYEME